VLVAGYLTQNSDVSSLAWVWKVEIFQPDHYNCECMNVTIEVNVNKSISSSKLAVIKFEKGDMIIIKQLLIGSVVLPVEPFL